jgi:hypothetical protein
VGNASNFAAVTGGSATTPLSLGGGITVTSYNFTAGTCTARYTLASSAGTFPIADMLPGVVMDASATPFNGTLVTKIPELNGKVIVNNAYQGLIISDTGRTVAFNTLTPGQIDIGFTTLASPLGIVSLYFNIPVVPISKGANTWYLRPGIDLGNVDTGANTTGAGVLVSNGTPYVGGGDLLIIVN